MTEGAQQALRRTMEIYSQTTRFALACNNSEKIIEAIQSRCAVLRYGKLSDEQILTKILEICKKENVSMSILYCWGTVPIWWFLTLTVDTQQCLSGGLIIIC